MMVTKLTYSDKGGANKGDDGAGDDDGDDTKRFRARRETEFKYQEEKEWGGDNMNYEYETR